MVSFDSILSFSHLPSRTAPIHDCSEVFLDKSLFGKDYDRLKYRRDGPSRYE
jgi:hypothetical protein